MVDLSLACNGLARFPASSPHRFLQAELTLGLWLPKTPYWSRAFDPRSSALAIRCTHGQLGAAGLQPCRPDRDNQDDMSEANASLSAPTKIVFWHRELPPLDGDAIGEYTVEATSVRVPGTIAHRDELWSRCYENLLSQAADRIAQEVSRLGGHYAHVLDEAIDSRRNDAAGEAWLHGRFRYALLKRAGA
jgi:hypothetical protein